MSDDVQVALREMARSIGGLQATVAALTSTWQAMEQKASDGRKELHQKVDGLRGDMTTMGAQLATATKDIAEMKPVVKAVENVKAQATGVRNATKWIWGVGVALSGGVVWIVTNLVEIHFKR
jgi:outer membrane murein-binding lipoprotein Lpp